MMSFDLHVHSVYSVDCLMDLKTIAKVSNKVMLSGLAITDHDTIKGALAMSKLAPTPLITVAGCEISTDVGHIVGLFLNEEIKMRDPLEVIDEIRGQGGVSVIAHPTRVSITEDEEFREMLTEIDAIEILSSRAPLPSIDTVKELRSLNKILLAGSDAHLPWEIGLCRLLINSEIHDVEELRKSILTNSTYCVAGRAGLKNWQTISRVIKCARTGNLSVLPYESLCLGRDLWEDVKHNLKLSRVLTIHKV